jgi:hypothetical protein
LTKEDGAVTANNIPPPQKIKIFFFFAFYSHTHTQTHFTGAHLQSIFSSFFFSFGQAWNQSNPLDSNSILCPSSGRQRES